MSIPPPPSSTSSSSKKAKKQIQPASEPSTAQNTQKPVAEGDAVPETKIVNGEERQRGPVEEVIAKRMRQLGKKLVRYRTYAQQPAGSLNADQKATLANLPALEGAYKELEDLLREKGPVDEQELIQAAKFREAAQSARAAAIAEAASDLAQYKQSLVTPLSLFLRLHTLLHPARSSDHEHLTFGHLSLPVHLQDEVQATDVLRVGRMWEDLTAGGESAQSILETLVEGPKGQDEENDHIHHLLNLLSQPEPSSVAEESAIQPEVETAPASKSGSVDESAETINPLESAAESEYEASNGPDRGVAAQPEPAQTQTINFLQDDELEVQDGNENVAEGIEDGYEVVPMLQPHQTSGNQQPPADESRPYTPPVLDTTPLVRPRPVAAPASFEPVASLNWADLDDEDDIPQSSQTPAADRATEQVITEDQQPAIAVVQQNQLASEEILSSPVTETPTAVESSPSAPSAPNPKAVPTGPSRGRGGRKPSQRQPKIVEPTHPVGKVIVDDDGFEMKVRRAPSTPARAGRGGRGGANGEIRGGRGRGGSSRGRGGGGQQGRSTSGGKKDGQSPAPATSQAQGQSKPSIFKSVQPTGPKSAPVIN